MAINQNQTKISVLAKDFNIKSKDIVDILALAGIEKKTSGTVDSDEFSVFFDRLTAEHQITNMSDYLAGKADIERPKVKEETPKPEEKTAAAVQVPEKPAAAPENKATETTAAPSAPAAKTETERKPAYDASKFQRHQEPNRLRPQETRPQQPAQPRPAQQHTQPQPTQQSQRPVPAAPAQPQRPIPQPQPQKPKEKKEQRPVAPKTTRIVDTRTTTVDLSKYDERLESFVPDSARRNNATPDRQKLKKQQNYNPYAKGNKDKNNKNFNNKFKKTEIKKTQLSVSIPDEIIV